MIFPSCNNPEEKANDIELQPLEKLAKVLNVSSVWTLAWTEFKSSTLETRTKILPSNKKNTHLQVITKDFVNNLKNESAVITESRTAHTIISEYQKEIESLLKRKNPFRLVFAHDNKFNIPHNLRKYSTVIFQSIEASWTILANPFSLVLDPTDWYQVKKGIIEFNSCRFGQKVHPKNYFEPKVAFPKRERSKCKDLERRYHL